MATKKTETKPKVKNEVKKDEHFATVIGGPLNVRITRTVDTLDNIVEVLPEGARVKVIKEGDEWCEIENGYVMRQFLQL